MDSNIKEYYIRLNRLYENAVNLLTAINQSLSTKSSQISVTVKNDNNEDSVIKIPSYFYLENKLEQLDLNFENLFKMPQSGEATMFKDGTTYKLELIQNGKAPQRPVLQALNRQIDKVQFVDNNVLKDMVSPKMFIRMKVDNISQLRNVDSAYMSKIVIFDGDLFTALQSLQNNSYNDIMVNLANYTKGVHYDVYENQIDLPIRRQQYDSEFVVNSVNEIDSQNGKWEVGVDKLTYSDKDNITRQFTLKTSDYLTIQNDKSNVIYRIESINTTTKTLVLSCQEGYENIYHTFTSTSNVVLNIHKEDDYSEYNYIDVPLEENQYIIISLATVYNNTRSQYSKPMFIDLDQFEVGDSGKHYMSYYQEYCVNIGDLILGLTEALYPQISNFTVGQLRDIETSPVIKRAVESTVNDENDLQVVAINYHLVDDVTNKDLINLHASKNELNNQIKNIQSSIDTEYNNLINTDFSQETSITQLDIQSKLQSYYSERTKLQSQLVSIVNEINTKAQNTDVNDNAKYRVRGVSNVDKLEEVLHETYGDNVSVVGIDIEYKYKSTTKDTTSMMSINSKVFTDWNKQVNIDRQRKLDVDVRNNSFSIKFEDYSDNQNVVKWNQFDIPIQQGEDVVIRFRYKYNIGQPFIDLYTPWSDEVVVIFPDEYKNNIEIMQILEQNLKDSTYARFIQTLIDEGYTKHIDNQLINGNNIFCHMPENIYSGFMTQENNLISLKDKLQAMVNSIERLETDVNSISNSSFDVYITYDDVKIELNTNTINTVTVQDSNNIQSSFIRKDMKLVIKNTGTTPLKLYSIFGGNTSYPLLLTDLNYFNENIANYQSYPLMIDNVVQPQTLGQWIYFRTTNPFTKRSTHIVNRSTIWSDEPNTYMSYDFKQPALPYRDRTSADLKDVKSLYWNGILKYKRTVKSDGIMKILRGNMANTVNPIDWDEISENYDNDKKTEILTYNHSGNGKFINKYEDIFYKNEQGVKVYLDQRTNIEQFVNSYIFSREDGNFQGFNEINNYIGAFVFPNLSTRSQITMNGGTNDYKMVNVGEEITVPITFEYYLNHTDKNQITKGLYFDIKNSLFSDPKHFVVQFIANRSGSFDTMNAALIGDSLVDNASQIR